MEKATENITMKQLEKAHNKIAELSEELALIKQKDDRLIHEHDELKMVAEQSTAMKTELEELHKQKEKFMHMDKGMLLEENMQLKRQIDIGTAELNKLQAEIIVLKSSDTQVLRTSFLAVTPNNDAEDHFIKQDSHFDVQTEKALLGEMRTELTRLRKLSSIGPSQPDMSDVTSPPMPAVNMEDNEIPQFDNNLSPELGFDQMNDKPDKPTLNVIDSSTIEPVWDTSDIFAGNPDDPLENGELFPNNHRRGRSKATSD